MRNRNSFFKTFMRLTGEYKNWCLDPNLSIKELRTHQDARTNALCKIAYDHTPFYRRTFEQEGITPDSIRSVEAFRSLIPVTTRELVQQNNDDFFRRDITQSGFNMYTAGSTGRPLTLRRSAQDIISPLMMERLLTCAGVGRNDLSILLYPPESSVWNSKKAYEAYNPNMRLMSPAELEEGLRRGDTETFSSVKAFFSYPYLPAGITLRNEKTITKLRDAGRLSLKALVLAGEILTDATRQYYARIYPQCRIMDPYVTMELLWMTMTCPEGTEHIMEDFYIPEILNKREDGSGEFYCTLLWPATTILLRYGTADIVKEVRDCPCGWNWTGLKVLGRANEDEMHKHLRKDDIIDAIIRSGKAAGRVCAENVCIRSRKGVSSNVFEIIIRKNGALTSHEEQAIKEEIISNIKDGTKGSFLKKAYSDIGMWDFEVMLVDDLPGNIGRMPGKIQVL